MSKQEDIKFLKIQTCILKVNIHCDGCKQKVKKLLQKIDGVYTTTIDAEHGKVTVSGDVDPATLIKKLAKAGKHAELIFPKGGGNNNQFSNGGKGGQKDAGKAQKSGNNQKGQQPNPLQQLKLFKDLNFPQLKDPKDQKSVKFMLPEEEEGSDFDDEFDDEDYFDDDYDDLDGFEDEFEDDVKAIKAKAMSGGGLPVGVVNEKKGGGGGGGGGGNNNDKSAKKGGGGGGGDVNAQNKGGDAKNGNGGGKKKGGGGGKNGGGGGGSQDGKNGGNSKAAANGNNNNGNAGGGKQGGGKGGVAAPVGGQPMNHQALMAQMANMNRPMGNIPAAAVQGLPAGGPPPGYFPGGAITPEMIAAANPYQQQQIAAMMQQQRMMMMNGQDRGFQPMAYARPPPVAAYMAPPPEYTHFFSDENTNSCTIM